MRNFKIKIISYMSFYYIYKIYVKIFRFSDVLGFIKNNKIFYLQLHLYIH
jgi:hypothetical protein